MIVKTYRCDLCRRVVHDNGEAARLQFSGCGGITFKLLEDNKASETIICRSCARGLQIPNYPRAEDGD